MNDEQIHALAEKMREQWDGMTPAQLQQVRERTTFGTAIIDLCREHCKVLSLDEMIREMEHELNHLKRMRQTRDAMPNGY